MDTSTFFKTPTRNTAIHLLVLLTVLFITSLYFPLAKEDGNYLWQPLALILLVITSFYVHFLVLLPIFLKRRNTGKYVTWKAEERIRSKQDKQPYFFYKGRI